MDCVVTGCAFIMPGGDWVAGDLFRTEQGSWVFNGNFETDGQGRVTPARLQGVPHYRKTFTALRWWERARGFRLRWDRAQ